MSFKIADGYVEVHARHDRASTRRNAQEAVREAEGVGKENEGSLLRWLFKTNPKLHSTLAEPIAAIFSSPIIFAAASTMAFVVAGFLSTALTTAILTGIAGGFIAGGAWLHRNDKIVVDAFTRMKKRIRDVFYDASKPIVGPLVRAMDMIGDAVERWEPSLTRIYKALAPLIEPFTGGVLGMIQNMLPGIERAMPGIQVIVEALAEHMPELGTAIGDFFATLGENGPLLERVVGLMMTWLTNFFKVAGPVIVFFMASFADMGDRWNWFMGFLKDGIAWIDKTWHAIPGWWSETWGSVKQWFKDLWNDISGFFSDTGNSISTWWNNQINNISTWWSQTWGSVSTWFQELPGKIGDALSAIPGAVKQWFLEAFDWATYYIGYSIGTWVNLIISFPGTVAEGIKQGWENLKSIFRGAIDFITSYIQSGWDRAIEFWTQTVPRIIGEVNRLREQAITYIGNMVRDIVNKFFDLGRQMYQRAQDAVRFVLDAIKWLFTQAPSEAGRVVSGIASTIAGLGGMLWNAGQDAIRGLINGISSMMGWAVDMAWRAARNIAEGFMDALGIGSPSKWMRDNVGKWIPKGIMVGIEDNMGDLDRFARDFPSEFGGDLRPPLAGSMTTTNNDNSTNYGGVKVEVHVDSLQELEDIKRFLDGQMRSDPKARIWAGNLYEQQGEYVRSYL